MKLGNIVWNAHYDIFGKIDKLSKNEIDNPIRGRKGNMKILRLDFITIDLDTMTP